MSLIGDTLQNTDSELVISFANCYIIPNSHYYAICRLGIFEVWFETSYHNEFWQARIQ